MNVAFPFQFDSRGGTATTDNNDHINDMLEQLLFTNPGERVNQPDFGSGVLQLVFAPTSPELAATVQFTLQAAIQRWLGDVISLGDLQVQAVDSTLTINISYVVRLSNSPQTAAFTTTV
jgi:uncharacterized protein